LTIDLAAFPVKMQWMKKVPAANCSMVGGIFMLNT